MGQTILLVSVAGAAILIYLPYVVVAFGRAKVGMDLAAPRAMFDRLPPYAQRATWAHQNSFEAFMIYSAAALMAYSVGVTSPLVPKVAIAFLVARALFSVFYILNLPPLRSLMFGIGTLCSGTLFTLSLMHLPLL